MNDGAPFVLDASALLALFHREKGWEEVMGILSGDDAAVYLGAVNYAEVVSKSFAHGKPPVIIAEAVRSLGIHIVDFDSILAEQAGVLKQQAIPWGLSLGDCACLVLSRRLGATAVTADMAWANMGNVFRIMFIR